RVNLQNLKSGLRVRDADFDLSIEPARTTEGRIEHLGNIRRAHHDDLAARQETIHQAEELSHNALLNLTGYLGALGRNGIDLVDEQDRGRSTCGFFEDLAKLGLTLAVELPHDLRAVEVNEVHTALGCNGARKECLARARWAVQQHAFGREYSETLE